MPNLSIQDKTRKKLLKKDQIHQVIPLLMNGKEKMLALKKLYGMIQFGKVILTAFIID